MLVFRFLKSFFISIPIDWIKFLCKISGIFITIILLILAQVLGIVEIIPTAYAITSLDDPIPIGPTGEGDSLTIYRIESHFYEEIPEDEESFDESDFTENPTLLPGLSNQRTAESTGFLVGLLTGLAISIYVLVLAPTSEFRCTAYNHNAMVIRDFLRNFF